MHRLAPCAVLALGLLTAATGPQAAELTVRENAPVPAPPAGSDAAPLHATCWQHGNKILEESGLVSLNLAAAQGGDALAFRRANRGGPVYVVPVGDAVCLVGAER
jgi:hypothetical protein